MVPPAVVVFAVVVPGTYAPVAKVLVGFVLADEVAGAAPWVLSPTGTDGVGSSAPGGSGRVSAQAAAPIMATARAAATATIAMCIFDSLVPRVRVAIALRPSRSLRIA